MSYAATAIVGDWYRMYKTPNGVLFGVKVVGGFFELHVSFDEGSSFTYCNDGIGYGVYYNASTGYKYIPINSYSGVSSGIQTSSDGLIWSTVSTDFTHVNESKQHKSLWFVSASTGGAYFLKVSSDGITFDDITDEGWQIILLYSEGANEVMLYSYYNGVDFELRKRVFSEASPLTVISDTLLFTQAEDSIWWPCVRGDGKTICAYIDYATQPDEIRIVEVLDSTAGLGSAVIVPTTFNSLISLAFNSTTGKYWLTALDIFEYDCGYSGCSYTYTSAVSLSCDGTTWSAMYETPAAVNVIGPMIDGELFARQYEYGGSIVSWAGFVCPGESAPFTPPFIIWNPCVFF